MPLKGSPTPWSYIFVRLLFHFVLKIFYGAIVVENTEYVPKTGEPWCEELFRAQFLAASIQAQYRMCKSQQLADRCSVCVPLPDPMFFTYTDPSRHSILVTTIPPGVIIRSHFNIRLLS
ncbi:hypothetical protein J3R82DRAFT_10619 [Butyriboletus roseoflavus]|nr:hypothetical protein J3R82DRAFT_10619 [Butyriboletus roseoflavus]